MISYKTEINSTKEQSQRIKQTMGVCRFVYNFYISHNQKIYEKENIFVSGYDFSKWINNEFIPKNQEYLWIKNVSSKAVKKSIMNAEIAFKRFFKKQSGFPKFKKKARNDVNIYLPKNNETDFKVNRHKIKIPTIGWVRLKEKGYLKQEDIKSCVISYKAGRYFISILYDKNIKRKTSSYTEGIGIDLGIKDFAIVSNGMVFSNINKTVRMKKLFKNLKYKQRKYSKILQKFKKGGGSRTRSKRLEKRTLRLQKIHYTISNIRNDYIRKIVNILVKTKPEFIIIEDLNLKGIMKNHKLARAIQQQKFYYFFTLLKNKCNEYGIELRKVDRFYPSSKRCSVCGNIKEKLLLSEREYYCNKCDTTIDRDLNASYNLRDCVKYKLAS